MKFKRTMIIVCLFLLTIFIASCRRDAVKDIIEVRKIDAITVFRYQPFESLHLPQTIEVTLNDGSKTTVVIAWDQARNLYQNLNAGTHQIKGQLILTGKLTNSLGLTVNVDLIIEDVDMMTTLRSLAQFSLFVETITAANLETFINAQSAITLFAPNNDAMLNMLSSINMTKNSFLSANFLDDLIKYHIVDRKRSSEAIMSFTPVMLITMEGDSLLVDMLNDRLVLNGSILVVKTDLDATNGVIHEIDGVLLPQSVLSQIGGGFFDNDLLEMFGQFLFDSGLLFQLIALGVIDPFGNTELTIFAPNNDAFESLLTTLDIDAERLLEYDGILDILLNHMVRGTVLADNLYLNAPTTITTVAGNVIDVLVIDGGLYIGSARVQSTVDLDGFGFVHVIDQFLLTEQMLQDLIDFANEN